MTETPRTNGVTAWITRLGTALDLLSKISLTTLLLILLGLVVATYYGWINSQLSTKEDLNRHDQMMAGYFSTRALADAKFIETLIAMRDDMARNSRAYRIRTCADIRDAALRGRCLDS